MSLLKRQPTYFDLFAGCGGMSLGMLQGKTFTTTYRPVKCTFVELASHGYLVVDRPQSSRTTFYFSKIERIEKV